MNLAALCFAAILSAAAEPEISMTEHETVERGLVSVRLDPKGGASRSECSDLSAADLIVTVGRTPVKVTSVERVPRPLRHWLLLDNSESAEGRREEAKRSAAQYVREVMTPGLDSAAVLTIDEDLILVAGPSDDPPALSRAIEEIPPGGWSALRDGLDAVLREIQSDRHQHLVVFWTDGEDRTSLIGSEQLLSDLASAGNATVFPIALRTPGPGTPTFLPSTFLEVARRSRGEVFLSTDGRWLEKVRGWIERRFVVELDPPATIDGETNKKGIEIAHRDRRCRVTILDDRLVRSESATGRPAPHPPSWTKESSCKTPLATAGADQLAGCVVDFLRPLGPYIRDDNNYAYQEERIAARGVRVLAPNVDRLPSDLAEAIDGIASVTPDDAAAFFMEGNALLTQRSRVASALFSGRPDYRDFALARLEREAAGELRGIESGLAKDFPGLSPGERATVARDSLAGRRALEAARSPSDADLARVLTAWIRDVRAADLLRDYELRLIDARLRNEESLEKRWLALRDRIGIPTAIRVAAPLALIHDRKDDVIGFVRVVLPRPERFRPTLARDPIDARLPARPFALHVVDAFLKRREETGYRATAISYDPLDPVDKRDPMRPFSRARVALTLARGGAETKLTATADILDDGSVKISGLD